MTEGRKMKTGKTSAATLGLVGGVVLGAWIGSELMMSREAPEPPAVTTEAVDGPGATWRRQSARPTGHTGPAPPPASPSRRRPESHLSW
jgi:hypothetical protein